MGRSGFRRLGRSAWIELARPRGGEERRPFGGAEAQFGALGIFPVPDRRAPVGQRGDLYARGVVGAVARPAPDERAVIRSLHRRLLSIELYELGVPVLS